MSCPDTFGLIRQPILPPLSKNGLAVRSATNTTSSTGSQRSTQEFLTLIIELSSAGSCMYSGEWRIHAPTQWANQTSRYILQRQTGWEWHGQMKSSLSSSTKKQNHEDDVIIARWTNNKYHLATDIPVGNLNESSFDYEIYSHPFRRVGSAGVFAFPIMRKSEKNRKNMLMTHRRLVKKNDRVYQYEGAGRADCRRKWMPSKNYKRR